MSINIFKKKQYAKVNMMTAKKSKTTETNKQTDPSIPDGTWLRCQSCEESIYIKDLKGKMYVCPKCGKHFRTGPRERLNTLCKGEEFQEYFSNIESVNPLGYPDYEIKINKNKDRSKETEAVLCGKIKLDGKESMIAIMNSEFMMGSMGSVVGEKLTRTIEKATELQIPVIIFTASGGARMQEGIFSLMQMAKTSAALKRHSEAGCLSITVLTDPTTGGVTASFAMLGDIILAEPKALIAFAGPRVIEQTIRQKLPEGFQRSEFLLEHGFVDKIVKRDQMKATLTQLLEMHKGVHKCQE